MKNPNNYLIFSNNQNRVTKLHYAFSYYNSRKNYLKRMHSNLMKYKYISLNYFARYLWKIILPQILFSSMIYFA